MLLGQPSVVASAKSRNWAATASTNSNGSFPRVKRWVSRPFSVNSISEVLYIGKATEALSKRISIRLLKEHVRLKRKWTLAPWSYSSVRRTLLSSPPKESSAYSNCRGGPNHHKSISSVCSPSLNSTPPGTHSFRKVYAVRVVQLNGEP